MDASVTASDCYHR